MPDGGRDAGVLPLHQVMVFGDTIAAVATAPGRSGVAVVRVSGSEALDIAERLTGLRSAVRGLQVRKVRFPPPSSSFIDECVLLFFRAPHSYTGEDVVEFQCHGGAVTPRRVLEACFAAGARLARRGEFTERAFLNGRLDYDQAESVLDLIDAKTVRAADAALEGLTGRKRRALKALYERALDLSTHLEHALDVDEGELPADFVDRLESEISDLKARFAEALRRANEGRILRNGALVVLAGQPNAGKSSLMNALLQENRAIVSDIPGTTRDSIEEWLDLDGWPIRLVDTAGLRETRDAVESEGVKRSEDLISKADLVLWLTPPPSSLTSHSPSLLLHPKCDLVRGEGLNVSVKTGEGLDELKREIVAKLETLVLQSDADESEAVIAALQDALARLSSLDPHPFSSDPVVAANAVRSAAERLGEAVGANYTTDLLDNLFSRFCVGK